MNNSIEDQLINELKQYINSGDTALFITKASEYMNETDYGRELAWDYIFQKIYIHACLKKRKGIAEWLKEHFTNLNPISQIALRPIFSYGKYLSNK